jgi:Uma2 family endonuclease
LAEPQRTPVPHRFTVEEYQQMARVGVLDPETRFELIDGEIIEMNPINWPHAGVAEWLNNLFVERYGRWVWVSMQNPVHLSGHSMPQPDLVLRRRGPRPVAHPTPGDVVLVVEVSDSTLAFDLDRKVPLYAKGGVTEVWVIDVNARVVDVFRQPGSNGYGFVTRRSAGGTLDVEALPDGPSVSVDEIFG